MTNNQRRVERIRQAVRRLPADAQALCQVALLTEAVTALLRDGS